MMRPSLSGCGSRRGAVLILVLITLAAVAVVASLLMREVAVEYSTTASTRATLAGSAALESGLLLATDMLMADKNEGITVDHLKEEWSQFPTAVKRFAKEWQGMALTGRIEDENGRFPINGLVSTDVNLRKQYLDVFVRMVDALARLQGLEVDVLPLVENMRHWVAPLNLAAPEDAWYATQSPSYGRSGRPFRCPEEMLLVRWPGVEPDAFARIFYGTEKGPGLREFITTWGKGPINMNTALPAVVLALCPDQVRAKAFLAAVESYRSDPDNPLATKWYVKVGTELKLNMAQFPTGCVDVKSTTFRVDLQADMGRARRQQKTVLEVSRDKCSVIFQQSY